MKKVLALLLVVFSILTLVGCSYVKTQTSDYQYIYDVVEDWNKVSTNKRTDILGYGEYLYNSYLILTPRETPDTLSEFYYTWTQLMDYNSYGIYFTCELDEKNFQSYKNGLEAFEISYGETSKAPLKDEEHFPYPTYILQWMSIEEKHEVIEYIMLDEGNHTVIYVYTMSELETLEENSDYDITPSEMEFLENDFSIYIDDEVAPDIFISQDDYNNAFESAEYNTDFLNNLFTEKIYSSI